MIDIHLSVIPIKESVRHQAMNIAMLFVQIYSVIATFSIQHRFQKMSCLFIANVPIITDFIIWMLFNRQPSFHMASPPNPSGSFILDDDPLFDVEVGQFTQRKNGIQ